MTAETALAHVSLDPGYQKYAKNRDVGQITLHSRKGCDASLHITMEKEKEDMVL